MTTEQLKTANYIDKQLMYLISNKQDWTNATGFHEVKLQKGNGVHPISPKLAFPEFEVIQSMALDSINFQIEKLQKQFNEL